MIRRRPILLTSLLVALLGHAGAHAEPAGKKPLELVDLMKLRQIEDVVIADDGSWTAYSLVPDRGDSALVVQKTDGTVRYDAARGRAPRLTPDGAWAAAQVDVPLAEKEKRAKKGKGKDKSDSGPKPGLLLMATTDGAEIHFDRVDRYVFSADGRWLMRQHAKPPAEDKAVAKDVPEVASSPEESGTEHATETAAETPSTAREESSPTSGSAPATEPPAGESSAGAANGEDEDDGEDDDEEIGSLLVLRHLATGHEIEVMHVDSFAVDDAGRYLAYAVRAPGGIGNGVFVRPLDDVAAEPLALHLEDGARFHELAWTQRPASDLAFVIEPAAADDAADEGRDTAIETDSGGLSDRDTAGDSAASETATEAPQAAEPPDARLYIWRGDNRTGGVVTASSAAPDGWFLPAENDLVWSRDAQRLFFGYRPRNAWQPPDDEKAKSVDSQENSAADSEVPDFDPYDIESILEDRTTVVWHVDDPLIQSNQRARWDEEKKRLYRAVYHRPPTTSGDLAAGRAVFLADGEVRGVEIAENPRAVLGRADVPYLRERTWDGSYFDIYWISLADGARRLVAERSSEDASISPDGRYVAYYTSPHWNLWDSVSGESRSLTASLDVPFANEDHDYPRTVPGYGVADWLADASAVMINDKYDIWSFATATPQSEPRQITAGAGRDSEIVFRLLDLDPERDGVLANEQLLLTGYHDADKHRGFYHARADREGVSEALVADGETLSFALEARDDEQLLFTRESYARFPDLWTARRNDFTQPRRLSDANPAIDEFGWGTAELVDWRDLDGRPLQGVLIKPAGYEPGRRYPVLVYFYRFFSQRLHLFNTPAVNHRPSFPLYASHGYAIFLPDIRFEIGRPGLSATKALVPGVQRLIDLGIADPDAIGLHGHSWSGYQTAFVVTQTSIFKAAAAGAPVSNMTSAYGGIRWGSGRARQFQYEMGQSRLGASLWQARDRYIDNSPLFFADRIETPLLLMHGDEDDAVPWYQSIELYLALRRLGKEAVFLQYRGEPHHPREYANKVDYSIKMKEFFDHYLKGEPAPAWLSEGVQYTGD